MTYQPKESALKLRPVHEWARSQTALQAREYLEYFEGFGAAVRALPDAEQETQYDATESLEIMVVEAYERMTDGDTDERPLLAALRSAGEGYRVRLELLHAATRAGGRS